MEQALRAWKPRLVDLARPYLRRAEEDDLVQEGWIAVWRWLEQGIEPTDAMIRNRMRNWCRTLQRQVTGRSDRLPREVDE